MNNYYTLTYLNQELNEKLCGGVFLFAISPHKDVIEIYIRHNSERYRLVFSTNPNETAVFWDCYRPPKKSNVICFFQELEELKILDIALAKYDRLLYLCFEDGKKLQFKLYSGKPNVYLVENKTIKEAFKNPDEARGKKAPEPCSPEFREEVSPRRSAKNQILEINPLLSRNLLPFLIEQHNVDEMNAVEVKKFTVRITEALQHAPHPRVLRTGDLCLWSKEILDIPDDRTFETVNAAVLHSYRNAVRLRRLHNKKEGIRQLLERVVSKKESLLEQLKKADKSLDRAEKYEKLGHLLMAHAHESIRPGTVEITVNDIYEKDEKVTIPVKEGLSVSENAAYYYDKAKSARKSYKQAKKRLPEVKRETEKSIQLLEQLEKIDHLSELDSWLKDHKEKLRKLGYGGEDNTQASSPYRKMKEGKYEIWIGKNAKSNDQLTSLAHKEDVWLHARGVGGSHVVIRMGNQKDYPPKKVILKAAGYAAYYSKARGMKSAPVMYTKRKYVRKPKGADPGAVVVEREQVEMVPPVKPENN